MNTHTQVVIITLSLILSFRLVAICGDRVIMNDDTIVHPLLHVNIMNVISTGTLVLVNGNVKLLRNGSREYIEVRKHDQVNFDDMLELHPNASVELLFEDNSTTLIGPVEETTWIKLKPNEEKSGKGASP